MKTRIMNISLIIPVYNEAECLDACLKSISIQTVAPIEVIVIDNNSTDGSAAIAESYSFVTLLHERRQGVVHARNRGFNAARGDIIGRIDADTILPTSWVSLIKSFFERDETLAAVSGAPDYYDFAFARLADVIDYRLRYHLSKKLGEYNFLWGANMAVRRSAWNKVRSSLCSCSNIHEDFDLAIHLQEKGLRVDYEQELVAGVSSRRIDTDFNSFFRYSLVAPRTYKYHNLRNRYHMYPVLLICWTTYVPARVIYRGYDPEKGSFSLNRLFMTTTPRIDPTTNIV